MVSKIRSSSGATIVAGYFGLITQAITNNFAPLLFLTFRSSFGLSLEQITLLTTINFGIQLIVDFLSARFVDRIGYRQCITAAHLFCFLGMAGLAVFPEVMPPYFGLMLSVFFYAVGGGLIEVLDSPIIESCPTENKASAMVGYFQLCCQ